MTKLLRIPNWFCGHECEPVGDGWMDKLNPHTGELLCQFIDSTLIDASTAITASDTAFSDWSELTPAKRDQFLADIVAVMKHLIYELVDCVTKIARYCVAVQHSHARILSTAITFNPQLLKVFKDEPNETAKRFLVRS